MKQTAVEWLHNQLHLNISLYQDEWQIIEGLMEQAKEMGKEHIIEAQENGFTDGCRYTTEFEQTLWYDGEQYYNETFKQEQ